MERANSKNVDTIAVQEALDMQPEELGEGKLTDINEKSGRDKEDEGISEELRLAKKKPLTLKGQENVETSHSWEENTCKRTKVYKEHLNVNNKMNNLITTWKKDLDRETPHQIYTDSK